jgi:nucleotidyltransferase substrate binding protein (TIGR01987 family)
MQDTRWEQRLENYSKALKQLENAVLLAEERELSDLEKQGLIQAFEFTHELAWNVMKDYFFFQGNSSITGSRDATREAFSVKLIQDGEGWMEMIKSRNKTSHTYNEDIASEITDKIMDLYFNLLKDFEEKMENLKKGAS